MRPLRWYEVCGLVVAVKLLALIVYVLLVAAGAPGGDLGPAPLIAP